MRRNRPCFSASTTGVFLEHREKWQQANSILNHPLPLNLLVRPCSALSQLQCCSPLIWCATQIGSAGRATAFEMKQRCNPFKRRTTTMKGRVATDLRYSYKGLRPSAVASRSDQERQHVQKDSRPSYISGQSSIDDGGHREARRSHDRLIRTEHRPVCKQRSITIVNVPCIHWLIAVIVRQTFTRT